jgi:cyclopropane fatty-acyl-phospholipid synthase-like methyltransferase
MKFFARQAQRPHHDEIRWIRRADGTAHAVGSADVQRYYEANTEAYVAGFGEVFQGSRPESTESLLSCISSALSLEDGMRVLDAGCGIAGPATWLAQQHGVSVEALTISPTQVKLAQRRVEELQLSDRVRVSEGDFHELDKLYLPASFERVVFLESLCHAHDYRRVLRGAHQALSVGGALYIKDFYVVDQSRDAARAEAQRPDLERLNALYRLELPRLGDLLNLICELGFLVQFARMPEFAPDYTQWSAFEQITGRHWGPKSGEPGEVIQGIEIFALKI